MEEIMFSYIFGRKETPLPSPVEHLPEAKKSIYGTIRNQNEIEKCAKQIGDFSKVFDLDGNLVLKIDEETSQVEKIRCLQQKTLQTNRQFFKDFLAWISTAKQGDRFLHPIDYSYANITTLYDCERKTILMHVIDHILKEDNSKLYLLDSLKEMGVNFNQEIKICQGDQQITVTPLVYTWWMNKEYSSNNCVLVANKLLLLGANINETFVKEECKHNLATLIAETEILNFEIFYSWFKNNSGDLQFKDGKGNTVLHYLLMQKEERNTALECVIVNVVVDTELDLSAVNSEGKGLLHILCQNRRGSGFDVELFKKLIEKIGTKSLGLLDKAGHSCLYYSLTKLGFINAIAESLGIPQKTNTMDEPYFIRSNAFIMEPINYVEYPFENEQTLFLSFATEVQKKMKTSPQYIAPVSASQYLELRALLRIFSAHPKDFLLQKNESFGSLLHALAAANYDLVEKLIENEVLKEEDLGIKDNDGITVSEIIQGYKNSRHLVTCAEKLDLPALTAFFKKCKDGDVWCERSSMNFYCPIHRSIYATWNEERNKNDIWDTTLDVINLLLDLGIDPNIPHFSSGDTALHVAVRSRNPQSLTLIAILNSYGADCSIRNNEGLLPIELLEDYIKPNNIMAKKLLKVDDF